MPDIVGNGDDLGDHIATRSLKQIKGSDVASADSILLQADGNTFDVTGTTTINHIASTNWVVGSIAILHFDASLQITNNAGGLSGAECNILLSGDADFTTQAGDILTLLLHDSTNWQEISRNSSGSVSNGSITNAKLADMAGNTVKVRNSASSGVPSDIALANKEILIGDGTGFTVASLSGSALMTNAGVVSLTPTQADITTCANLTTTGALNAGSITTNFGTINNGSSAITTTGTITGGQVTVDNFTIANNKIEITNTNGNLQLDSNGTGVIEVLGNTNDGAITLNCTANSHGQTIKSQPHSATATNTMLLPLGANSTLVSEVSTQTLTNKTLGSGTTVTLGSDASIDVYYRSSGGALARLAKGTAGQALKMNSSANGLEWGSAGGGATIVHTYTNTTNTSYLGTASSFSTVGVGDRDIFIKKIDANNEGVFTKIWKNGSAVEVQIA